MLGPDSSLGPDDRRHDHPAPAAPNGDPERAVALASMLALMVGVVMAVGGIVRLGFVADLLSKPTMIGYMNGLAVTILIGQLPKLFGFSIDANGLIDEARAFVRRRRATGETVRPPLAVGLLGLVADRWPRRFLPKVPGVLVAVVVVDPRRLPVQPRRSRREAGGDAAAGLPAAHRSRRQPVRPGAAGGRARSASRWSRWPTRSSTASAFAARAGEEVNGNLEMVGIGAANIGAGLFQGFPVSTSGSRTAVAEQAGAKTQVTGLVGAAAIAAMLLVVPGLLRDLPQPTLAAVVIAASLSLADVAGHDPAAAASGGPSSCSRSPRSWASRCWASCPASPWRWRSRSSTCSAARGGRTRPARPGRRRPRLPRPRELPRRRSCCPGWSCSAFDGPLFFANTRTFREVIMRLATTDPPPRWIIDRRRADHRRRHHGRRHARRPRPGSTRAACRSSSRR